MPYKDPQARKECGKRSYAKNKEKIKEAAIRWRRNNPDAQLYYQAMYSAKTRGLEFSITRQDIIIPEFCPYLGFKLTNDKGRQSSNISIDRIDNTKGYVPGNVQVISYLANMMKHNATLAELVLFAKGVLALHDQQ